MSSISPLETSNTSGNQSQPLSPRLAQPAPQSIGETNSFSELRIRSDIETLLVTLKDVDESSPFAALYNKTLELLPHFQEADILGLQNMLDKSGHLWENQLTLAQAIGAWYVKKTTKDCSLDMRLVYYRFAMHYYGKSVRIAERHDRPDKLLSKECHRKASSVLLEMIKSIHGDQEAFCKKLTEVRQLDECIENFMEVFNQVQIFEGFCTTKEEHQTVIIEEFYRQVRKALNAIQAEQTNEIFKPVRAKLQKNPNFTVPEKFRTEVYREGLTKFRALFEELNKWNRLEDFQNDIFDKFRDHVMAVFLKDAMRILGPPPMSVFDVRAGGSVGKKEFCPFSDLEAMLIFKEPPNASQVLYWKQLWLIIDILMRSLGESKSKLGVELFFPAAHKQENSLGLHLDSGPHLCEALMNTAEGMAGLQEATDNIDPASVENMSLKTESLYSADKEIEKIFYARQKQILDQKSKIKILRRHCHGLTLIRTRLEIYGQRKRDYGSALIDLKKLFVEPLNYLLADIALYKDIRENNTIRIIRKLTEKGTFDEQSGRILLRAVETLYKMRCRLHLACRGQQEEALTDPKSELAKEYPILTNEEIFELKKIRFLILPPLYALLKSIFFDKEGELQTFATYQKLFEKKFKDIDLLNSAFDLFLLERDASGIEVFVRTLFQTGAVPGTHLSFYQKMSKTSDTESLRSIYITTVKSEPLSQPVLPLLYNEPNLVGQRQIEIVGQQLFESLIKDPSQPKVRVQGRVTVEVYGPGLKGSLLHQNIVANLFDNKGQLKSPKKILSCAGDYDLYFKVLADPSSKNFKPPKHQPASLLLARIFGQGMPVTHLLKFDVRVPGNPEPKSFFVQVSLIQKGRSSDKPFETQNLDRTKLSQLFLSIPLLLPGDLEMSDWLVVTSTNKNQDVVNELQIVDLNKAWTKPLCKRGEHKPVWISCLPLALFTKHKNFELDPKTIQDFLCLKSDQILKHWLKDLHVWNNLVLSCHPPQSINPYLCHFDKGFGIQIMVQFHKLQTFLKEKLHDPVLAPDILKTIVSIEDNELLDLGPSIYEMFCKQSVDSFAGLGQSNHQTLASPLVQKLSKKKRETSPCKPDKILHEIQHIENITFLGGINIFFVQNQGNARLDKCFAPLDGEEKIDLATQEAILKRLILHKFDKLNLSYCETLTDDFLKQILETSGKTLTSLDLRFCGPLTEKTLTEIASSCPHLVELRISGQNVKYFLGKKGFLLFSDEPLCFPSLKFLEISQCPHLNHIHVRSERLSSLVAAHNPVLKGIVVESAFLRARGVDKEESPKAQLKIIPMPSRESSSWVVLDNEPVSIDASGNSPPIDVPIAISADIRSEERCSKN